MVPSLISQDVEKTIPFKFSNPLLIRLTIAVASFVYRAKPVEKGRCRLYETTAHIFSFIFLYLRIF